MEFIKRTVAAFYHWWQAYAYPSQETAALLQVLVVSIGGLALLSLWLRWQQGRHAPLWVPASGSLIMVLSFVATLHLQTSFYGEPDARCHLYQEGQLKFELVQVPTLIAPASGDPRDDTLLLLVVRAPARFADALHVCAVPAHLKIAQDLPKSLSAIPEGESGSSGVSISFTFGNGFEPPNVTWKDFDVPAEKGPPDITEEKSL